MKIYFFYITFLFGFFTMNSQCITKIDIGYYHNIVIKSNGTLWAWGSGGYGQLGNGSETDNIVQTQVGVASNWMQVAGGAYYNMAVKSNGTLWAAGDNSTGQLGIGTTAINANVFTQIGTSTNWQQVSTSNYFTLALKTNGTLWGWGQNDMFQMGDGSCCNNRLSPGQIGTATDWALVAASGTRTGIALKTNGTMWGWGSNSTGILGPSNLSSRQYPTQLNTDTDWTTLSVGAGHVLALKTNGTLWSWGAGGQGQTADNLPAAYFRDTPVQIGNSTWLIVAAGYKSSYGIKTDGTLWAWGWNNVGQLGDGTTIDQNQPVQIGTDTDWVNIAAGVGHAVALKANGALWTWGDNYYGQFGNGTTSSTPSLSPQYIAVSGCTLDVPAYELNSFIVGPNPVHDELHLSYKGQENVTRLLVYDMLGKLVYETHPIVSNSIEAVLPVQDLSKGLYIVALQSNGTLLGCKRFLKE